MSAWCLLMDNSTYETTPFRVIPALFAGAAAGSACAVLALSLGGALVDGTATSLLPRQVFNTSFMLAPFVFFVFAAGGLFVAGPCWWVLHRMGRRTCYDAMLAWAMLCAAAGLVPPIEAVSRQALGDPWRFVVMATAGLVSGLVFWRIAYRSMPDGFSAEEST
ncbi:MAG: hypothetical protein AB7O49_04955 [Sphingomonadales bacterium]